MNYLYLQTIIISLISFLNFTNADTYINCFSSLPSSFSLKDSYAYQTSSYCSEQCSGYSYFALFNHSDCYCGNDDPTSTESTTDTCNAYCYGYGSEMCGGEDAYSVYSLNSDTDSSSASGSSITSSRSSASGSSVTTSPITSIAGSSTAGDGTSVVYSTTFHTEGGSTVFVTNTITQNSVATGTSRSSSSSKKKKTNIGAIVGGVVGGVVGAIVIAVIALFGLRHYNMKKEEDRMEKEYQEAIKPVEYTENNINDTITLSSHGSRSFDGNTKDDGVFMKSNSNGNIKNNSALTNNNPFDDTKHISTGSVLFDQAANGQGNVLTVVNPDQDD